MFRKLAYALLLVVLTAVLLRPLPVYAIADPDTPPQVGAVYVYEFSDGTLGVLVDYYLDYAALPTETATESYIVVFIDTDGTTQLKSSAPYTFVDSGYGRGLVWIQFTAAEVALYSIDSTDILLYRIWLVGNPTLAWVPGPDPPKTIATIDQWNTTTVNLELANRVLYYADVLELAWSLDMVTPTAIGNKLTTNGENYFMNVIPGLRTLAPLAFSSATIVPGVFTPITESTIFSAVATSGTATLTVSPDTLTSGSDTVNTGATTGTFTLELGSFTFGTVTNGTGTVAGSPVSVYPGTNTLTVTGAGTFTVAVAEQSVVTTKEAGITGTGIDLTSLGTAFGMSRWMISGLVWIIISVIAGGALLKSGFGGNTRNLLMLVFAIMLIGGTLLGLVHPNISATLFIFYGAFIGYILFFRSATGDVGRMAMFAAFMFLITTLAGSFATYGQSNVTTTYLTSAITDTQTLTIPVASTVGFPNAGIIMLGEEEIVYPTKNATNFLGTTVNPITRGSANTEAAAHGANTYARTRVSWTLNASLDYRIVQLTDNAGSMNFLEMGWVVLQIVGAFVTLPVNFLGTEMMFLAVLWAIFGIGFIVTFGISVIGARRV